MKFPRQLFLSIGLFLVFSPLGKAQQYVVEKLDFKINSEYDEISPVVDIEGKTLYFTRVGYPEYNKTLVEQGKDLSQTMEEPTYNSYLENIYTRIADRAVRNPEASNYNQDIWIATTEIDTFDNIIHPGYPLNNALPNSVCAITPSKNELVVINQFKEEGGMQKGFSIVRQLQDGSWSFPDPIKIENYYNTNPDVSMTISNDGGIMVLAMQRGDSYGQTDLYVSFKVSDRLWSEPKSLGRGVNSSYRESTPFISDDNKTIFYSSNRAGSRGMDLYLIEREDDSWTKWSKPRRFVKPINSKADESQPFFNAASGYLYFTSRRDVSSDIYRVKISPPNPPGVIVKGKIYNSKTRKPISSTVISGPRNADYKNIYVSDDGSYRIMVPKGMDFVLTPEKAGYTSKEESVSFKKEYVYFKEYHVDLYLDPMEVGTKIDLDPIYFKQSTAEVLDVSHPVIDQLADFLKENKNVHIRIAGHTDNMGEVESLQKLSEERAKAIKHYLVYKKLLNPVRIITIGFGSEKPVNDNSSEDFRQANRRVEVEITHISSFEPKKKQKR